MFVDTYSVYVVEILQVSSVFSNYKEKNTHKIKDPHKVDDELWPLVCCMNRGNAQSKKMGKKHTGQCETQTADCRLRTRGKMQTECKMQTAD